VVDRQRDPSPASPERRSGRVGTSIAVGPFVVLASPFRVGHQPDSRTTLRTTAATTEKR
jgi:hypothetical protein